MRCRDQGGVATCQGSLLDIDAVLVEAGILGGDGQDGAYGKWRVNPFLWRCHHGSIVYRIVSQAVTISTWHLSDFTVYTIAEYLGPGCGWGR